MPKDWVIPPPWEGRTALAAALGVSPVMAQVLFNRDIADPTLARQFLRPHLSDLIPPEALPGATAAADRIARGILQREKIVLFGDYDVDGITGVAILWHCLRIAGAEVDFYIPHRLEEGYGIQAAAIDTLADGGASLIVTVDCGVTAVEPAARARYRGVELIITDHHLPHSLDGQIVLPDALLVHPSVTTSGAAPYPNSHLSGAGVAFKLAWAIAQRISGTQRVSQVFKEFLVDALGLAALGIIADVVPLVGENRLIARHGLSGLRESRNPGIRELIESAGLTGKALSGFDIGFKLAPRLNAIGRMGHARLAVDMLTRAAPDEAVRIAAHLEQQNRARQSLERRIVAEARDMVTSTGQDGDAVRAIVLASGEWHPGVIGIVAGRLTEEFCRPTVLIALENGVGQGSARSVRNFALHEALASCRSQLITFGGHAMAAGLRIDAGCVDAFRESFQARAAQLLTAVDMQPKLRIDDVVELASMDERLVHDFARLEPFGAGNASPRLATDWLELGGEPRAVGSGGDHLQISLKQGGVVRRGIAFGMAKVRNELLDHRRCRVAFVPTINEWNGQRRVEMQVLDFQFPVKRM
jgi:single-stranded-DNA-specific exonuclease